MSILHKVSTCTEMFARIMDLQQTLTVLDELRFEYFDPAWRFLEPYVSGKRKLTELRDVMSTFKVKPAAIMGTIDFGVSESRLPEQLSVLKKHLDAADHLGTDAIRVFASLVPEQYIDEQIIRRTVDNIKKARSSIEEMDIKLGLENHFGITSTAEDVLRILEGVGSPCVGVTFDPANFVVSKEDPVRAGRKLAPHIIHTHLKDCVYTGAGRWAGYEFVEIGAGVVDYRAVLSNLKEDGYAGYLSLEYERADDVVRGTLVSRKNLQDFLSEA
ncbi:MAG: sugar phosphate isomerase/epimerase family protein [Candidatus Bathyarchaeia archaeon]